MEFFKRTPEFDFIGKRRIAYAISALLVTASCLLLGFRGLNLGVDFTGGVVVEATFPGSTDVNQVRTALEAAGHEAQVQAFGTSRDFAVRLPPAESERDINQVGNDVAATLSKWTPGVEIRRTEVVGPQVGEDLTEQGGLALLFTFVGILLYIAFRFEKKMAVGAVVAALHNPILILGFFSASRFTFDLSALAALLAAIGYQINDTVVVFDRTREVFVELRKATPAQVFNAALNQTLSRTLMTSISVLLVVVSLYLFGGETLRSFSLVIILGVVVGTYSSIFVASALAYDMKLKAPDLMKVRKHDPDLDALP
jgi:preprotein translocase subunit SecF